MRSPIKMCSSKNSYAFSIFLQPRHDFSLNIRMQTQRCFAVNPSVDPLLDVARQTYADVTSDIHDTANKYQQVYPSFNIRLVHNSKRGYHLMMRASEEVNTQAFILVNAKGGNIFFSTEELESLNQKCNEAVR
jgi:hypothetical protein